MKKYHLLSIINHIKTLSTPLSWLLFCGLILSLGRQNQQLRQELAHMQADSQRFAADHERISAQLYSLNSSLARIALLGQSLDRLDFFGMQALALQTRRAVPKPLDFQFPTLASFSEAAPITAMADGSPPMVLLTLAESLSSQSQHLLSYFENIEHHMQERHEHIRHIPTLLPVNGMITSPFGVRKHPIMRRQKKHKGIDIAAPRGTPVHAAADGHISFVGYHHGYGKMVMINHGHGLVTKYAHNSKILVRKGMRVQKGDKIAEVGTSGFVTAPHLHYEVLVRNVPVNPEQFISPQLSDPYRRPYETPASISSRLVSIPYKPHPRLQSLNDFMELRAKES